MKRKLLVTICFGIIALIARGQDSTKIKRNQEFFLEVSDFSPVKIGLVYKIQLKNDKYLKVGLINLQMSREEKKPSNLGFDLSKELVLEGGVSFGLEFRKELSDFLTFYHGPNLVYIRHYDRKIYYSQIIPNQFYFNSYLSNMGGLSYSFGILARLSAHIFISADINPMLSFNYNVNGYQNQAGYYFSATKSVDYNFSTQMVKLSLVFRR